MEKKKKSGNQKGKKYLKSKSTLSDKSARCPCDCEATKHPLVNNCLDCGRIICLSEGPGPCFFCGNMVNYNNQAISSLNSSKEMDSNSKLFSNKKVPEADPSDTIKLRDKLLQFDKDSANRTTVIDDECDYYQTSNQWLTKSEREQWEKLSAETYKQKHKSRLEQKLCFDFTGRVFKEEEDPVDLYKNMNAISINRNFDYDLPHSQNDKFQPFERATYVGGNSLPSNTDYFEDTARVNRVQDKTLLEISDQGVCLSMHQPYASLLVRGIKKTEGRTWYSAHRGRLWIASAAREAHPEEIATLEEIYRLQSSEAIEFPKTYPTGCLIGCVNVTDVMSQEEYMKLYPNDKVDSPYIFLCENFLELPIKYPIQGKHKIYKLDSVIHRAALTCLEKITRKI